MMDTASPSGAWPALALARRHDPSSRRPVMLRAPGGLRRMGSVAESDVAALAAWPHWIQVLPQAVVLDFGDTPADAALAEVHQALRAQGLIRAWRDEPYPWFDEDVQRQAVIERAASRLWGALTFGAHCNGYVADPQGRPSHLWIARRSLTKATDPGRLDNLIGGGVPLGQTPREALRREAWEEAGLTPTQLRGLHAADVLEIHADIAEGLQHEWLFVYDLALPDGVTPCNQDGEVAEHRLLPVDQALACAADGSMTTDAALATLAFALRWRLLPEPQAGALAAELQALRVPAACAARIDPPAP